VVRTAKRGERKRLSATAIGDEIDRRIRSLPSKEAASIRAVRRDYSRRLQNESAEAIVAIANKLLDRRRWVTYELIYSHPQAIASLDTERVERLGRGIDSRDAVDPFALYISGPAWRRGSIPDEAIRRWARSEDRFWRRAALVSTVPLNLRAAGGTGDTARTLDICRILARDRDELVVKAMSWALRELALWDANAVRRFLEENDVAARVRREVLNKLDSGLKNPRKRSAIASPES
jgi:3-methyladenine DNA glycosylase AlkD